MNAFSAAADVLAADPNLSGTGTFSPYLPATGTWASPVPVRVMPWQQEEIANAFGVKVQNPGRGFKLLQREVPLRPRKRDRIVFGGFTYSCKADAQGDVEGTEWTCNVDGGD